MYKIIEENIGCLPNGYVGTSRYVPPKVPINHHIRNQYDDRSIDCPVTEGSIWIEVWESCQTKLVAVGVFACDGDKLICDSFDVLPDFPEEPIVAAIESFARGKLWVQKMSFC